jgi:hypothetical protein
LRNRLAVAQLDLHGKAGGVADALDRRRRDTRIARLLDHDSLSFRPYEQRAQILARAARAPLLQDQIGDAGIGEAGRLSSAEMPAMVITCSTPGVLAAISLTWSSTLLGPLERRAVGQLHGGQQIALVLDRHEAGRHPRQAVAATPIRISATMTEIVLCATSRRSAAHSRARAGHRRVEAAIEEVALLRRHRRPQPQRALRRLQRRGVDGASSAVAAITSANCAYIRPVSPAGSAAAGTPRSAPA